MNMPKDEWRVNYSSESSFKNWVDPDKLDLTCVSHNKIGLLGSAYFMGFAISSAITPKVSDTLGRKKPYLTCLVVQLSTYLFVMFSKSLNMTILYFLIVGLCAGGRVAIGTNYMSEFIPLRW
jgi:MFS family permease